jgi:hypothetical protein
MPFRPSAVYPGLLASLVAAAPGRARTPQAGTDAAAAGTNRFTGDPWTPNQLLDDTGSIRTKLADADYTRLPHRAS